MAKNNGMVEVPTYKIEVRLGGDIIHTIWKEGVTQKEITLLRAIHGQGGVAHIEETGKKLVNEREELYELACTYSKTLDPSWGIKLVQSVFNTNLDGFSDWRIAREDAVEQERYERQQKANQEAARLSRARDAAEATERARMLTEQTVI